MPDPLDPMSGFAPSQDYEPGSSLPGVPHSGLQAPTQSEAIREFMERQQGYQMTRWLLQSDTRAQFATGLAAHTLAGNNAQAWMNSDAGKMANLGLGAMINSGMVSGWSGGSVLDTYAGISNYVGARGVSRTMLNGLSQVALGRGAVTDQISQQLYTDTMREFYNPITGGSRMEMTSGLDRSEMGSLISHLGQSGALPELRASIQETADGKKLQLSEADIKKFNDTAKSAAAMVRAVRDITGSKEIGQLLTEAQQMTGVSLSEYGGIGKITARVQEIQSRAEAYGIPVNQLAGAMANNAQMTQATFGYDARTAAGVSYAVEGGVQQGYLSDEQFRAKMGGQGIYVAPISQDERRQKAAQGVGHIQRESLAVVGAVLQMSQDSSMSDADKATARGLISKVAQAGTMEGEMSAKSDLQSFMQKTTGRDPLSYAIRNGGVAGVMSQLGTEDQDRLNKFAIEKDQTRMFHMMLRTKAMEIPLSREVSDATRLMIGDFAGGTFSTLSKEEQGKMVDALRSGQTGAAADVIKQTETMTDAQKSAASDQLAKLNAATGSPKTLGAALQELQVGVANDKRFANTLSKGDQEAESRSVLERRLMDRAYGTGPSDIGIIKNVINGITGETNINESMTLRYAKLKSMDSLVELKRTKEGGVDVNADQLKKIRAMLPDFTKGKSDAELMAGLRKTGGESGMLALSDAMTAAGVTFAGLDGDTPGKKGSQADGIALLGKADSDKAKNAMADVKERQMLKEFYGLTDEEAARYGPQRDKDDKVVVHKKKDKERARELAAKLTDTGGQSGHWEKITTGAYAGQELWKEAPIAKHKSRMEELVHEFSKDGLDGKTGKMIQAEYKENASGVIMGIDNYIEDLKKKETIAEKSHGKDRGHVERDEIDRTQKLRDALTSGATPGGAEGTMKITATCDDKIIGTLVARGLKALGLPSSN